MKKIIDMLIPQKSPYKKWTFFFEIQNLKYTLSRVLYQTENSSLVLYDKSKFLLVPVTNNGTLVPSLTVNYSRLTPYEC